jgi:hypothetical protein
MSETIASQPHEALSNSLAAEYAPVVVALEKLETELRVKHIPNLLERAPPLEADDLKENTDANGNNEGTEEAKNRHAVLLEGSTSASLKKFDLKIFSTSVITKSPSFISFAQITSLDVSNNELMDLPGLSSMPNLHTLNLERNWFNTLPLEIGKLTQLKTLLAPRNFLRPNASSLLFPELKLLKDLKILDLLYNQKLGRPHHRDLIKSELTQVEEVKLTMWEEVGNVPGSYVGASAAERDEHLLRSQLEPWGTVNLRRRLVQDFGEVPTDAAEVDRAGVMQRLLKCYEREGWTDERGHAKRKRVHVDGAPVNQDIIDKLLVELRAWTDETGKVAKNRERPSIRAQNYMILRSPKFDEAIDTSMPSTRASRRAIRKAKKLEKYRKIWDLAQEVLKEVDEVFAERCTEIAVTYGFRGSPHIDKQNCGPFYGFAMGEFPDGQGGVCVECSARVVAVMNTKNRIGRVDGRYPHFVDAYDKDSERYSLIYYETGNAFVKPGPAIFSIPKIK